MSDGLKGILALVATSSLWGFSGIYFHAIGHIPVLEVLAHRVVWSVVFFLGVFAVQGRLREFGRTLATPRLLLALAATACVVSVNWGLYIWAVQEGHATEASLGYYIFPLVAVALGFAVFGERFSWVQSAAIALAALAILVLTVSLGTPPWIALILGTTFGIYGLIKKALAVGPVMSVAVEVTVLSPVALIWLGSVHLTGGGAFGSDPLATWALPLSVFFTGVPLVLFSYASRRLAYATLGLVQYLNPSLQFLVATLYLAEPFTRADAIAFPLIWAGVALYCVDIWRRDRSARRIAAT